MGAFDDLIPQKQSGGAFADLIPKSDSEPVENEEINFNQSTGSPVRDSLIGMANYLPVGGTATKALLGDKYSQGVLSQGVQGATFGFADEGAALMVSAITDKTYEQARDEIRNFNNQFAEQNPVASTVAQVGGGLAAGVAGGAKAVGAKIANTGLKKVAAGVSSGILQGGVAGAGFSDGETVDEVVDDTVKGAKIGAGFGLLAGGLGAYASSKAAKNDILRAQVQDVLDGNPSTKVVKAMLKGGEKVGASPNLAAAHKQGIDEGMLGVILGSDKATKKQMFTMSNIQQKAMDNPLYAQTHSANDVVGDVLEARFNHVLNVNKKAGTAIDEAATALKGKSIDYQPAADQFLDQMADLGVKLDKNGLNFKGSDFAEFPASQKLITNVFKRASTVRDAQDAHKLKRVIDRLVTYDKTSMKGVDHAADDLVKTFRNNIDTALDGKFKAYDEANTLYAKTIKPLQQVKDLVGKNSDVASDNFNTTLGTLSLRMNSRAVSKGRVHDAFKLLNDVADETGGGFEDDYLSLAAYAGELQRRFGTTQVNSFAGQGQIAGEGVLRGRGVIAAGVETGLEKIKEMRFNDEKTFQALRGLLSE
jgi:hypothetical protein